jgi:hypothetical protein
VHHVLQIEGSGRLGISDGTAEYSLLRNLDTDISTNTRIIISRSARLSYAGDIQYF